MEGGREVEQGDGVVVVVVGQREFKDLDETKRYDTGTY